MGLTQASLEAGNTGVSIYALCCPVSGEVRYIGKANNPAKRLKSHMRDARRRNTPVCCWIRSLGDAGLAPSMRVLSVVDPEAWPGEERRLIAEYRPLFRLLNLADGGNEPHCPQAVRANNGRKNALALHSDPERKRIWNLKRNMGHGLHWLEQSGRTEQLERIRAKLRAVALKRPDLFGAWANV